MKRRDLLISSLAVPAMASPLYAQSDKPLRLMVGFPAGGSIDTVARTLADKMKDDLRQPVIVENKPGAGGRLVAAYERGGTARATSAAYAFIRTSDDHGQTWTQRGALRMSHAREGIDHQKNVFSLRSEIFCIGSCAVKATQAQDGRLICWNCDNNGMRERFRCRQLFDET